MHPDAASMGRAVQHRPRASTLCLPIPQQGRAPQTHVPAFGTQAARADDPLSTHRVHPCHSLAAPAGTATCHVSHGGSTAGGGVAAWGGEVGAGRRAAGSMGRRGGRGKGAGVGSAARKGLAA